jgi:hypothetical protein
MCRKFKPCRGRFSITVLVMLFFTFLLFYGMMMSRVFSGGTMTIAQIAQLLTADIVCHDNLRDKQVSTACGSDMMSDVMAFYHDRGILLTGLINVQVVRTASLLDLDAVCFVRGKKPTPEMISLAEENNIVLMQSDLSLFLACGMLYAAGLKGSQAPDGI